MSAEYINPDSLEERIERLERLQQRLPLNLDPTQHTDANGWAVSQRLDGRKEYRQHWLGVALPAAGTAFVVTTAALPVGVASQAAVDPLLTIRLPGSAGTVVAGVEGAEATTTLSIVAGTTDATNLSTKAATIDIFVTLVARP